MSRVAFTSWVTTVLVGALLLIGWSVGELLEFVSNAPLGSPLERIES